MKKINIKMRLNLYNKISFLAFLILIVFCAKLIPAFAIENKYTNQLLKLNIDKSVNNKINVTVVTSNPYKIKISPIKRSDNEYVIFLPETYHSITTNPDISAVNELQDVDVKLIPYIGSQNNNGYTKITVRTKSPDTKLNVNDEVLGQAPKANNELLRLINKKTGNQKIVSKVENTTLSVNTKVKAIPVSNKIENNKINREIPRPERKNKIISEGSNNFKYITHSTPSTSVIVQKQQVEPQKTNIVVQKPVVKEVISEKTANPAAQTEVKQITAPVSPITPIVKVNPPVVKKIIPPIKQDNSGIKIGLVCLIAFLTVLIFVLRYFKSLLAKQMKIAEEKAIASKSEITLPRKATNTPDNIEQQTIDPVPTKKQQVNRAAGTVKRSRTGNVMNNNIEVIQGFEIEGNKGIYLIQTKYNKILIGTINAEVFILKEFSNIENPTLIVKKEKALKTKNVYYVQVNNWRSLISVAANNIKLELELDKTLVNR